MQIPDLWIQITHGKISVQIQVLIFDLKIPAGQVQVDPQVNLWHALLQMRILMCLIQFGKVSNDLASLTQIPVRIVPSGFEGFLTLIVPVKLCVLL
jgi:hypothetical protein